MSIENMDIAEHVPAYKILGKDQDTHDQEKDTHVERWFIQLGQTHTARLIALGAIGPASYADVDFVHVTSARVKVSDSDGDFWYEETSVMVSDEDGEEYTGWLYFAQRKLSLEEALFSIGEV